MYENGQYLSAREKNYEALKSFKILEDQASAICATFRQPEHEIIKNWRVDREGDFGPDWLKFKIDELEFSVRYANIQAIYSIATSLSRQENRHVCEGCISSNTATMPDFLECIKEHVAQYGMELYPLSLGNVREQLQQIADALKNGDDSWSLGWNNESEKVTFLTVFALQALANKSMNSVRDTLEQLVALEQRNDESVRVFQDVADEFKTYLKQYPIRYIKQTIPRSSLEQDTHLEWDEKNHAFAIRRGFEPEYLHISGIAANFSKKLNHEPSAKSKGSSNMSNAFYEKYNIAAKTPRSVQNERSPSTITAKVIGYDNGWIKGMDIATGEEMRFRLADEKEFASLYVYDDNKSEVEKIETARRRINNRPTTDDMLNARNLNFMPVGGTIEVDKPRLMKGCADNERICAWFKGVSNDPEKELVVQGKALLSVKREPTNNTTNTQPVDRDRKYSLTVIQDQLAKPLLPENAALNKAVLNDMMAGYILDQVGKPITDAPGAFTQAFVTLEAAPGAIESYGLRATKLIDENNPAKGYKNDPEGLDALFRYLKNSPLNVNPEGKGALGRTAIISAVAELVGYDKDLPFDSDDARKFSDQIREDVRSGSIKVVAAPHIFLGTLNTLKIRMTDLALDDKGAGRLKDYTNKGYFPANICLRTATMRGELFNSVVAKSVSVNAPKPSADYKPLWPKVLMENALHDIHPSYTSTVTDNLDTKQSLENEEPNFVYDEYPEDVPEDVADDAYSPSF